ncbi:MAG: serine/threonine-protein kinase [Pseudomonadota bacterium]
MNQEIRFRKRQRHGKYRIESCLLRGPYANVYSACDTVEGVKVALKLPHKDLSNKDYLSDFLRETRIAAKLEHENVLPLKDASFINDIFTMVTPLGAETLEARLKRRLSNEKAFDYAKQLICGVAYAHEQGIMHCDIKPANLILFGDGRLRLADFGIAKTTYKTIQASGSGTLGYLAPEQAMGRPSFRSDVFAVGLILHQMLSGALYEWPFRWPSSGYKRLKQRAHPKLVDFLRKALEFQPNKRFRDGPAMRNAWILLERRGHLHGKTRSAATKMAPGRQHTGSKSGRHWREIQFKQFQRRFGKALDTHMQCTECQGPIAESMTYCPWCKTKTQGQPDNTRYASVCPHCQHGVKNDWEYCPWCYGSGFETSTKRRADKRYTATCHRKSCGGPIMPFMKYCPWCHARTKQQWTLPGMVQCEKCNWGIAGEYWDYCPWCSTANTANKERR